ncbi:hypothetical protein [Nostoc sp. MG11]|uniref:hypothetical protein n=1 Tax=Nostoc sp. MG11 TaxID=2721166 RepID=UPI001865CEE8|nr:hypothetical protein [Nostoc sp. MG11]
MPSGLSPDIAFHQAWGGLNSTIVILSKLVGDGGGRGDRSLYFSTTIVCLSYPIS